VRSIFNLICSVILILNGVWWLVDGFKRPGNSDLDFALATLFFFVGGLVLRDK